MISERTEGGEGKINRSICTYWTENVTHPRIELDMVPTFSTSVEPAVNLNDSIRGYLDLSEL